MGAVYLATHPLLGRKAAIKVLLPEHSKRADLVTRFFNEAKTAASLRHPALVEVFDFGFLPDGAGYLVMDFLEGESLAAATDPGRAAAGRGGGGRSPARSPRGRGRPRAGDRPPRPQARQHLPGAGPGAPGSRAGEDPRLRHRQAGVARHLASARARKDVRTSTGMLLGTPLFMAPEQCRGLGQGRSPGGHLFGRLHPLHMLTGPPALQPRGGGRGPGRPPARGGGTAAQPGTERAAALEAIVLRALDKNPDARFQTMADLASELQRFLAPPRAAEPVAAAARSRPRSARPGLVAVAGFLVVAGAAGVGVYLSLKQPGPPAARAPQPVPVVPAAATPAPSPSQPPVATPPAPTPPVAGGENTGSRCRNASDPRPGQAGRRGTRSGRCCERGGETRPRLPPPV